MERKTLSAGGPPMGREVCERSRGHGAHLYEDPLDARLHGENLYPTALPSCLQNNGCALIARSGRIGENRTHGTCINRCWVSLLAGWTGFEKNQPVSYSDAETLQLQVMEEGQSSPTPRSTLVVSTPLRNGSALKHEVYDNSNQNTPKSTKKWLTLTFVHSRTTTNLTTKTQKRNVPGPSCSGAQPASAPSAQARRCRWPRCPSPPGPRRTARPHLPWRASLSWSCCCCYWDDCCHHHRRRRRRRCR